MPARSQIPTDRSGSPAARGESPPDAGSPGLGLAGRGPSRAAMPVGLGVDAVEVARFRALLGRRPGLAARLFTDVERADAGGGTADPAPRLAARFAAKEAAFKALGVGLGAARFREVEVRRLPSGAPQLGLSGRAAALAAQAGVEGLLVSLTHTAHEAVAVVVALGPVPFSAGGSGEPARRRAQRGRSREAPGAEG
jgi:holo-[acyl-carrier protein] synthase